MSLWTLKMVSTSKEEGVCIDSSLTCVVHAQGWWNLWRPGANLFFSCLAKKPVAGKRIDAPGLLALLFQELSSVPLWTRPGGWDRSGLVGLCRSEGRRKARSRRPTNELTRWRIHAPFPLMKLATKEEEKKAFLSCQIKCINWIWLKAHMLDHGQGFEQPMGWENVPGEQHLLWSLVRED